MHQTKVPGLVGKHCVITPTCRNNRTKAGAFSEAARQLMDAYHDLAAAPANETANFHLVLTVERPN